MRKRYPPAFLLVAQASACVADLIDYKQLLGEVDAGRIVIDPMQTHEGVWLLDYAIEKRLASSAGQRDFRRQHGADQAMDELWSRWLRAAPLDLMGDSRSRALRIANLVKAGSSLCLDDALRLSRVTPDEVMSQWSEMFSPALRCDILVHAIKEDLRKTVRSLVAYQFANRKFPGSSHPLLQVKSATVMRILLDAGVDPNAVPGSCTSLIDQTSRRDLPSEEMQKIIQVIRDSGKVEDTPEQRFNRLHVGLESKTTEQLQGEMRAAKWSPSQRRGDVSPIIQWARNSLSPQRLSSFSGDSGALSWLARQPTVATPQPGQDHSEAAWIWAALYINAPYSAEKYAVIAKDLPPLPAGGRLKMFRNFLCKESLPMEFFEVAVSNNLSKIMGPSCRHTDGLALLLEDWFTDEGGHAWILGAYCNRIGRSPDVSALANYLPLPNENAESLSRWMSLALVVAYVQEDAPLMSQIKLSWASGVRPLAERGNRSCVLGKMRSGDNELVSWVQAWDMDLSSPLRSFDNQTRPRL